MISVVTIQLPWITNSSIVYLPMLSLFLSFIRIIGIESPSMLLTLKAIPIFNKLMLIFSL